MSLVDLTATEQRALLLSGQVTATELAQAHLDRIEQVDGQIGAYLTVDRDGALAQAADVDQRRRSGQPVGSLAGLPVSLKDIICTAGLRTTCASKMLADFVPPYEATLVAKLKAADAVILGKTNMDEFAMGGSTENSALGVTRNPWDLGRTPGGSSGGAAASVAGLMASLAVGTDTGGSIRQPANYCGVTGLKPTYGRVSRYGIVAFASSLDQAGPLARTAEDAAMLLEVLAGHDPHDSTSANVPVPQYTAGLREPLAGLKIGIAREHFGAGLSTETEQAVRAAIRVYESLGAGVQEVSLPHAQYGIATYYIIAPCEASSNLARYDGVHFGYRADERAMLAELAAERRQLEAAGDERGLADLDSPLVRMYRQTRAEGFGAEVKRRIMLGTYALSAGYADKYYVKALQVRRLIRRDFDEAFRQVDLIAGPVTPTAAFRLGEKIDDPLAMYLTDLYTVSANLAAIAGISIPCGLTAAGLPIGLQLQAPPFEEQRLLRAAFAFQQATDWHARRPPLVANGQGSAGGGAK